MVIEHRFISKLDPDPLFKAAADYLSQRGFYMIPDEWHAGVSFEMRRGVVSASKARSIVELPQQIRIEYDRGRVAVAALIEPSATWGGSGNFTSTTGSISGQPKKMGLHRDLMIAIVTGLENLLAHDGSGELQYEDWLAIEAEAERRSQKHRRNQRRLLIGALTILGLLVLVIVYAQLR